MGVGFKVGGSGYFKSILSVVANPGAVVTIESDTSTQQKTADNNGNTSFIIKRKGHYTVTTDFGATAAIDILAYQNYSINVAFDATVRVQANPSAVVTLTNYNNNSIYYQATANSSTGIAVVSVKRAGSYTVSSNNAGGFTADGNTNSVTVDTNGSSQNIQFVKLNIPASLAVANYSSNALTAYWTRPGSLWTGVNLRRNTGSAPASRSAGTSVYTGAGNTGIVINNSNTVNGYTNTGLTAGTRYYYSIFSYITINGTNYWATTYRTANGTAANYVGATVTITSTNNAWAVPTGWRTLQAFLVGGGGAGGAGRSISGYAGSGGAGGGGGYTKTTGNINVTPGQTFACTVGGGGTGSTASGRAASGGNTTFNGVTANGGQGGYSYSTSKTDQTGGGAGGSGGGGRYESLSNNRKVSRGGNGGTNGGDGETTTTSSTAIQCHGGAGQGSTTRAFGASSGTAYSGGGGGASYGSSSSNDPPGSGGSYGGGAGARDYNATSGTANSGGGGGGGVSDSKYQAGGSGGSGVIILKCVA